MIFKVHHAHFQEPPRWQACPTKNNSWKFEVNPTTHYLKFSGGILGIGDFPARGLLEMRLIHFNWALLEIELIYV